MKYFWWENYKPETEEEFDFKQLSNDLKTFQKTIQDKLDNPEKRKDSEQEKDLKKLSKGTEEILNYLKT